MPAFGSNRFTAAFARRVLYEPVKGFRLNDRIVSAIDRFIGALTRFVLPTEPGIFTRWLWIYPFVGATDWTHALNLADAPDSGYAVPKATGKFNLFSISWSGVIHNNLGVTMNGGTGNTNCDMADVTTWGGANWNRRTHGLYSRTNSTGGGARDMTAEFVEPRNGYTYIQGIHLRNPDGNTYGQLCYYAKSGVATTPNQNQVAVSDSLGLFTDTQRGPTVSPYHFLYKRGAYIAGENSQEVGMGYGDVGSNAWMYLTGTRNLSFFFSTRHPRELDGTLNSDGSGGLMPGGNGDFNLFVEQLQVALLRNV
jgi:hypothetical protein